jgi:predicted lipoprotein with Yx(FWY)xxD motif
MRTKGIFIACTLAAAALALGACGDDDTEAENTGAEATVAVESVDGVGEVLVDARGAALYTADQEADGSVRCTAACAADWLPLAAPSSGEPTADPDVEGKLGVTERPDGSRQVTLDGVPLYRFADDGGPGVVSGDGLSDRFAGELFSWQVAAPGAAEPASEPSDSADPYGGS